MRTNSTGIDWAKYLEPIVRRFQGAHNPKYSNGHELRWGTKGSFVVDVDAGTWYDHEHNTGGGTIDYLTQHGGCSDNAAAAAWIKKEFNIKVEPQRRLVAEYEYRDEHGSLKYKVQRYSAEPRFRQQRWDEETSSWVGGKGCLDHVERLPFLLPQLLHYADPDKWVYICEGEKDVLNLSQRDLAASCNSGGAGNWQPEISQWFKDRNVVLLPDNDDAGRKHAAEVAQKLNGIAKRIRILELPGLRNKGDVSDWLDQGGTIEELEQLAEEEPDWQPSSGGPDPDDAAVVETDPGPIALGYSKDGRFILLDRTRQVIGAYSSTQLTKIADLLAFAPMDYWAARFPAAAKSNAPFNPLAAGEHLIEQCRQAGAFDMSRVRGRGIWREGERIVVNLGEPIADPRYICFQPIQIDASAEFDTARLLELLRKFRWRHERDAMLLLGWLAIAPVCGVLTWRPHIWIHGKPKTGKTTLHELQKFTCAPLSLSCDGGSTEAGIRQTIGPDSLPVIIDEFESDQQHIKGILRLARTASSAEDPLLRGTPEGKALNFCLRTTFGFSSVNPLGMSVADESRIVMLELLQHDNDLDTAAYIDKEVAYFARQEGKWCSFIVSRAALIPEAVKLFEYAILSGDRRHQQNMATLLAGAFVALEGRLPNEDDLNKWGEEFISTVEAHAEEQERDDGQECLDYLLAHMVRSQSHGEMPLRHWLAVAIAERGDGLGEARNIVEMYDMRIKWPKGEEPGKKAEPGGVYIKNNSPVIERIYANSQRWAGGGWKRALRKLDDVEAVDPMKFDTSSGGKAHRATRIPLDYVPSAIGAEDEALRRKA